MYRYDYPRLMNAVDVVLLASNEGETKKVLLVKRAGHIEHGKYALPGGFVDPTDMSLKHAAVRELHEECNLYDVELIPLTTRDKVDRDPRGRVIGHPFLCTYFSGLDQLKAGDDASDAGFFSIPELLDMNIAFDHMEIIQEALEVSSYER